MVDDGNVAKLKCKDCPRPFIEICNGKAKILSRHGSTQHENELTIKDLRAIELEMYRQLYPPEKW